MFKEPSRVIPKNYRNITGKFSSTKSSRLISYESKLERDFLHLFELSNSVIQIVEQPFTLEYKFGDKLYKYTPDFYLKTPAAYDDIIVEVKYHDELKTILPSSIQKYRAVQEYLKNKKTKFCFYTDRCQFIKSDEYRFNTSFLLNYKVIKQNDYVLVEKLFYPYITIEQLLNLISQDKYKQLYFLDSVWCMIRRNILRVDLFEKLSLNTQLLELLKYDEKKYEAHLNGEIDKGYLL